MKKMRLVITGSRNGYADLHKHLNEFCLKFCIPSIVILGDALGVDRDALRWVQDRNI